MVAFSDKYVSLLSQLGHFLAFSTRKPKKQLETGMLIFSIDVDVGSRELGEINKKRNHPTTFSHFTECEIGDIEEAALPLFIETFDKYNMPATFAIRGQLTELSNCILDVLFRSPVDHDIGAHGYYHREFSELSSEEADDELKLISKGMEKFGIRPKSFVFPRNKVNCLHLLERHGYECYRGYGRFLNDDMYIEKKGHLYNIQPSLCLDHCMTPVFLLKILDIAIKQRLPFHVWFHLWGFGNTRQIIKRTLKAVFSPVLEYAIRKEKESLLNLETMLSATTHARCFAF